MLYTGQCISLTELARFLNGRWFAERLLASKPHYQTRQSSNRRLNDQYLYEISLNLTGRTNESVVEKAPCRLRIPVDRRVLRSVSSLSPVIAMRR
jgi:hypothetical protein